MIQKPHENLDYQNFLTSDLRSTLIPTLIYTNWFDQKKTYIILDFGCGKGYSSMILGNHLKQSKDTHIYACDYQEELLDLMWSKVVRFRMHNITPFALPSFFRKEFPRWLPLFDDVIFSFSLSSVENPFSLIENAYKSTSFGGRIHVFDWQENGSEESLDKLFPSKYRLPQIILSRWVELNGYQVQKVHNDKLYFYIQGKKSNLR